LRRVGEGNCTEFSNLQYTGIFKWIEEVPERRNVISGHIICKEKLNEQRVLAKRKVCVIAWGFSQVLGKDFTENFMLVLRFTILQILLAIIAYHNFELY